jgi:hypothetical protein
MTTSVGYLLEHIEDDNGGRACVAIAQSYHQRADGWIAEGVIQIPIEFIHDSRLLLAANTRARSKFIKYTAPTGD